MLLPILKEQGIVGLVYTADPNISNELLKVLTMGEDCMRVMKRTQTSDTDAKTYKQKSSGAVTTEERTGAVNLVLLAKRYTALVGGLSVTEIVSMLVGAALSSVLAIGGMHLVPAVCFGLWQAAWCATLYFLSRRSFGRRVRAEDEEN